MVILSNSAKRASVASSKLAQLGLDVDEKDIVTSGEVSHQLLKAGGRLGLPEGLGALKCVMFNGPDPEGKFTPAWLDGLPLEVVDTAQNANFILGAGVSYQHCSDGTNTPLTLTEEEELLQQCGEMGLPFLCLNPDLATPPRASDGVSKLAVGSLAEKYQSMFTNVQVSYLGKPHSTIYDYALQLLENECGIRDLSKICMVGDSLIHDIAGANAAGIDSIWLQGGVHANELGVQPGPCSKVCPRSLADQVVAKYDGIQPTICLGGFTWE